MEKISVIVINWNVYDSFQRCLQSLRETKYPNLEIISIDNNSDTKPHDVTIQNDANIGFPKAVNQGLNRATGDMVVLLNPDSRVPKDFFKKSLEFFSTHPDAGVMGPKFVNPDGTPQGSIFPEPSIINTFREFWLGKKDLTQKYSLPKTSEVFSISGGCMVIPRKTIEKVGLFTEEIFMYYEDLDFCRRIHKAGLKVYYFPEIILVHEHGQSSRQLSSANTQLVRSSIWYNAWLKHHLMWFISRTGQKFLKKR